MFLSSKSLFLQPPLRTNSISPHQEGHLQKSNVVLCWFLFNSDSSFHYRRRVKKENWLQFRCWGGFTQYEFMRLVRRTFTKQTATQPENYFNLPFFLFIKLEIVKQKKKNFRSLDYKIDFLVIKSKKM